MDYQLLIVNPWKVSPFATSSEGGRAIEAPQSRTRVAKNATNLRLFMIRCMNKYKVRSRHYSRIMDQNIQSPQRQLLSQPPHEDPWHYSFCSQLLSSVITFAKAGLYCCSVRAGHKSKQVKAIALVKSIITGVILGFRCHISSQSC